MLILVSCQSANEYSHEEEQSETLFALRTPYIGDAPAVSRIVQALPLPAEGWLQRFFAVETSTAPYSLTVFYEPVDLETVAIIQSQEKPTATFETNALLLFSLIENLDEVVFAVRYTPGSANISYDEYDYFWTTTRKEIAELFGVSYCSIDDLLW